MVSGKIGNVFACSVPNVHYCFAADFLGCKAGHVVIKHLQAVNGPDLTECLLAPMLQKAGPV